MDKNHLSSQPSSRVPANNAEHIFVIEVSESDSNSRDNSVSNAIDYSKTLINDFEMQRSKGCFRSGQVWACYDYHFSLKHKTPRLYVQIMEVVSDDNLRLRTSFLVPAEHAADWK
ncbi:hypothetical protein ACH5RR_033310 [Cinchona calisaya]|uniref:DUF3444 domain-containing protein n=1 Tax=Cinchona calisaya TaxID=153742 RepID=A0ABD2YKL6_9GENT